jgi:ABC-type multidrug transport system ATPase subunit
MNSNWRQQSNDVSMPAGSPHPPLVVSSLTKRFGSRTVLAQVSLELEAGQCLAFVGRNGSGKSTLLACVSGNLEAESGVIQIAGHDLRRAPVASRHHLRYLAQENDAPLGLTGRELASFIVATFGALQELSHVLELADLGNAIDHLVSTYSLGMRRRLALASLCCGTPSLFVLDEPFAGLDLEARDRIRSALLRFQRGGSAFLIAGHEQDRPELQTFSATTIDPAILAGEGS